MIPPLLAPLRDSREAAGEHDDSIDTADSSDETHGKRRRRRKRSRRGDSQDWESGGGRHRRTSRKESRQMQWMLAGGVALLGGILLAVFFATRGDSEGVAGAPDIGVGLAAAEPEVAREIPRRSEFQFATDAEPVVRAFLDATSVEALLETVDRPEIAAPRISRHFPDGLPAAPGLSEYHLTRQIDYHGPYGTLFVRTGDFEVRRITLREYPEGLKVDWESWAGWSDQPWDEFLETRPSAPGPFRVLVRLAEYYNFDFADDQRWQSYRLDSPDGEHSLHGYVERDSLTHERIRSVLEQQAFPMILELSFPEDPQGRGQVVIHRQLADHWIDPARIDEP